MNWKLPSRSINLAFFIKAECKTIVTREPNDASKLQILAGDSYCFRRPFLVTNEPSLSLLDCRAQILPSFWMSNLSICNIRWLHCFYARRMKPFAMQTHLQEVPVSNGSQGQIVKLSLTFAICHYFAISVNLTHPSTPLFHLSLYVPLWCLSLQANDYFGALIHRTYHQWQKK